MSISLAEWMELALYDPLAGYYAAGRVRFGDGRDFWTFPERLSPVFGRLVATHAAAMCAVLERSGALSADEPFTITELGAGDGTLARDICDAALELAAGGGAAARLLPRLRYRIGERSPALQGVQARTCSRHANRLAHLAQGAGDDLPAAPPFKGLLLSNELVDVYPHHRVRPLDGTLLTLAPRVAAEVLRRLGIASGDKAIGLGELRALARAVSDDAPPLVLESSWATLAAHEDARAIAPYLEALAPLIALRARAHPAPPELLVSPRVGLLQRWAAERLVAGWVLTLDYGGTALHALDPEPTMPHLRTFPTPDGLEDHYGQGDAATQLDWPGRQDVTVEVDFSHLAWAGALAGLHVVHYGPQGHLLVPPDAATADRPSLDPMAPAEQARIRAALTAKYGLAALDAARSAWSVGRSFSNESAGFRLLLQATAGLEHAYLLPHTSDPVLPSELPVLRPDAAPDAVARALVAAGLPVGLAAGLRPWACPIADLDDQGHRALTGQALLALREAGLLAPTG